MSARPRRVTSRPVAKGEDALAASLIGGRLRIGHLQGVSVNFQHPDLPPDYEALPWWYVWQAPPSSAGLIFPSEAAVGLEALRNAKGLGDLMPIFAEAGDTLTVARVEVVDEGGCLDHPHDREVRLATLALTKASGEIIEAGPLAFYGCGRVIGHGSREAFDHILDRVLRHAGTDQFPGPERLLEAGGPWGLKRTEDAAMMFAKQAHDAFHRVADPLADGDRTKANLQMMINAASLSGFLLAKLEHRSDEEKRIRQIEGARLAAQGKTPADLLKAARKLAAEPGWSRTAIARELEGEWGNPPKFKDRRSIQDTLNRYGIGPPPRGRK